MGIIGYTNRNYRSLFLLLGSGKITEFREVSKVDIV